MKVAYLIRQYFQDQTRGAFTAINEDGDVIFTCVILELPWRDNARQISCIPEGCHHVKKRWTKRFKSHYKIEDVPDRSNILIHPGNFVKNTLGCQLPGESWQYIDDDPGMDVLHSRATLDKMLATLGDEFKLYIGAFEPPNFPHKVGPAFYAKIPPHHTVVP